VRLSRGAGSIAIAIAIVLSVVVPASQLRTMSRVTTCCCPDPAKCHCPDHRPDHSKRPMLRGCHREAHEYVSTDGPPAVAVAHVIAAPIAAGWPIAPPDPTRPRDAPLPARPDAPS
jgi:hypothetical protein